METMTIDCAGCRNRGPACDDCVVQVLLEVPVVPTLTSEERDAVVALAGHGLVPPLRLQPGGRQPLSA